MKIKFAVISNTISGDKLVTKFDNMTLRSFQREEIKVEDIKLVDLVGIGKMPPCLVDWTEYDKVVLISNSATAVFFLDAYEVIKNAELWIINWPEKISGTDSPQRHRFFDMMPEMVEEAKRLMTA